ncbi:MAG: deoxyguanosinetriphosphate triphosphohydrolase [Candidatus Gastranaerophilales bacterium]|nr:deoxyguanosinetriphosphate triphosphohydrolase [Candidatus Gastranaerophilales bacterium]
MLSGKNARPTRKIKMNLTEQNTIKYKIEQREIDTLSEFATKSRFSLGRKKFEDECSLRTDFQRDRDRIVHSKAFRRLKHKTQVFLSPFNDHFRTRLTHTLEVSQIGRTIARALDLNEDLVEAIALGHDLGHTPFGHCGEGVLNELMPEGFHHNLQSVRVVEVLENLNLCQETVDGILTHTWGFQPKTPEAQVVQLADKIAYINHDIEDSTRAGIISESDLPKDCIKYFSSIQKLRLNKMIEEIIENSMGKPIVSMSEEGWHYTTKLREWMFENVYINSPAKLDEHKAEEIIKWLFNYYLELLTPSCGKNKSQRIVCDYISGMTDRYAIEKFKENFIPSPMVSKTNDDYLFRLAKMID